MAVLSVQSFVAYGHVGNSAAVYPLQSLGVEVWPLHTVTYSGHLGRSGWRGHAAAPQDLLALAEGLANHGCLARCQAVLSGFLGGVEGANAFDEILSLTRRLAPNARWICDPVIGDHGHVYVPLPLAARYLDDPGWTHADVLTPNRFELGYLCGRSLRSLEDVVDAARSLLARGVGAVVVKGSPIDTDGETRQHLIALDANGCWRLSTPHLLGRYAGTGDLFTSLLTAGLLRGFELVEAAQRAAGGTLSAIRRAQQRGDDTLQIIGHSDWLDHINDVERAPWP